MTKGRMFVFTALALVVGACSSAAPADRADAVAAAKVPKPPALQIGSAVRADVLASDPAYAALAGDEFHYLVPENEFKWSVIHPERNTYNWAPADAIVAFARAHNQKVHGHALAWGSQLPAWLVAGTFTQAECRTILVDHIMTVVTRYRDDVTWWDVVNEAVGGNGELVDNFWRSCAGDDYIEVAFAAARAADPDAELYLNDFGMETYPQKAAGVFALATDLKARGVPIDGVGYQMHVNTLALDAAQLRKDFRAYREAGLDVAITEMDVWLALDPQTGQPHAADLKAQKRIYRQAIAACRGATNCSLVAVWGFTDRYSWVSEYFPGYGAATMRDADLAVKPAYQVFKRPLR